TPYSSRVAFRSGLKSGSTEHLLAVLDCTEQRGAHLGGLVEPVVRPAGGGHAVGALRLGGLAHGVVLGPVVFPRVRVLGEAVYHEDALTGGEFRPDGGVELDGPTDGDVVDPRVVEVPLGEHGLDALH